MMLVMKSKLLARLLVMLKIKIKCKSMLVMKLAMAGKQLNKCLVKSETK